MHPEHIGFGKFLPERKVNCRLRSFRTCSLSNRLLFVVAQERTLFIEFDLYAVGKLYLKS